MSRKQQVQAICLQQRAPVKGFVLEREAAGSIKGAGGCLKYRSCDCAFPLHLGDMCLPTCERQAEAGTAMESYTQQDAPGIAC